MIPELAVKVKLGKKKYDCLFTSEDQEGKDSAGGMKLKQHLVSIDVSKQDGKNFEEKNGCLIKGKKYIVKNIFRTQDVYTIRLMKVEKNHGK